MGLADFDLVICDEAHRTTGVTLAGEDESNFVRVHDADYLAADRRLYMTATPRIFDDDVKAKAEEHSAVLASMDDETIYGPEFHRLGFGDAVERGLLTDYKVLVLTVDEALIAAPLQQQLAGDDVRAAPRRRRRRSSAAGTGWPSGPAARRTAPGSPRARRRCAARSRSPRTSRPPSRSPSCSRRSSTPTEICSPTARTTATGSTTPTAT